MYGAGDFLQSSKFLNKSQFLKVEPSKWQSPEIAGGPLEET